MTIHNINGQQRSKLGNHMPPNNTNQNDANKPTKSSHTKTIKINEQIQFESKTDKQMNNNKHQTTKRNETNKAETASQNKLTTKPQ